MTTLKIILRVAADLIMIGNIIRLMIQYPPWR